MCTWYVFSVYSTCRYCSCIYLLCPASCFLLPGALHRVRSCLTESPCWQSWICCLVIFFWAITKNGYTRSVWSQKRVHPGIKSKIHSTSHAIGQKQIVPVFQRLWPGYTCKWLLCLAWLSTVSDYLLLRVFVLYYVRYLVVYGFGRYFLLVFGFAYICSSKFSLRVSFHSIQPLCAPAYVGLYIHMYKSCTYHYDCCIISLWIVMGHKTGTHRDEVKTHTLAATKLLRGFGTLTLRRPDPSQTWAIQTEPGHVEVLVYNKPPASVRVGHCPSEMG